MNRPWLPAPRHHAGPSQADKISGVVLIWRVESRCDPTRLAARGAPPSKKGCFKIPRPVDLPSGFVSVLEQWR